MEAAPSPPETPPEPGTTSSGSSRWSPRKRPSSSTPTAQSSAAPRSTSPSASSTSKRWPAARPSLPAPWVAFWRWWSMASPARWYPSIPIRSLVFHSMQTASPHDLAARLAELMANPASARRWARQAQARRRNLCWKSIAAQTVELYRGLLKQKSGNMEQKTGNKEQGTESSR